MRILRELRAQRGITLTVLADAVGLTPGYLSQLERSQVSPSVETLGRLARYYAVPMSFFFEDDADGVAVTRRGSHFVLRPEEGGVQFELLSPDLQRRIEFLRITLEPGGATHSHFNTHPGEEVHYVLRGGLEVEVASRSYRLEEGDTIYFHSTLPHRVRNPNPFPTEVLTAMSPPTRWARAMLATHGGTPTRAPQPDAPSPRRKSGRKGRGRKVMSKSLP